MNAVSKTIVSLAIVAIACAVRAGINEDLGAANTLFGQGDYVKAQKAYENILKNYPDAAVTNRAAATIGASKSIRSGKGHAAALEAEAVVAPVLAMQGITDSQRLDAKAMLVTYAVNRGDHVLTRQRAEDALSEPTIDKRAAFDILLMVAYSYRFTDDAKAVEVFDRVITGYVPQIVANPSGPTLEGYAEAYNGKGACLSRLGRHAEAGAAYAEYITYAAKPGNTTNAGIQNAFLRISPKYMSTSEYRAALEKMLNAIPVEGNTEILGKIKSELLKVK